MHLTFKPAGEQQQPVSVELQVPGSSDSVHGKAHEIAVQHPAVDVAVVADLYYNTEAVKVTGNESSVRQIADQYRGLVVEAGSSPYVYRFANADRFTKEDGQTSVRGGNTGSAQDYPHDSNGPGASGSLWQDVHNGTIYDG